MRVELVGGGCWRRGTWLRLAHQVVMSKESTRDWRAETVSSSPGVVLGGWMWFMVGLRGGGRGGNTVEI